jgi:hypothetical protein
MEAVRLTDVGEDGLSILDKLTIDRVLNRGAHPSTLTVYIENDPDRLRSVVTYLRSVDEEGKKELAEKYADEIERSLLSNLMP